MYSLTHREIFHTLENRGNSIQIEEQGPCKCLRENSWLTEGYYFWEGHIYNAHWWGQTAYQKNGYYIFKTKYILNNECFDLYDNPIHQNEFNIIYWQLHKRSSDVTVRSVIKYLRDYIKEFSYSSVRCGGNDVRQDERSRVPFRIDKKAYLDLYPLIQICFFKKKWIPNSFELTYDSNEYI